MCGTFGMHRTQSVSFQNLDFHTFYELIFVFKALKLWSFPSKNLETREPQKPPPPTTSFEMIDIKKGGTTLHHSR